MEVSQRHLQQQLPYQGSATAFTPLAAAAHNAATTLPLSAQNPVQSSGSLAERIFKQFVALQPRPSSKLEVEQSPAAGIRERFEKFAAAALMEIASEHLPEGFSIISAGQKQGTVLAIPTEQFSEFSAFMQSAAGSMGGIVSSKLGAVAAKALGSAMGVNPAQSAALEASAAAIGSAAGGAAATAVVAGAGSAAAGSAALAAGAAAWPAVAVIAAYTAFTNVKGMKAAVGGGPLTKDEIAVALDVFGADHFTQKATPDEFEKILPKESGGIMGPALVLKNSLGKALFGSGKNEDQLKRDRVRKHFEKIGLTQKVEGSHHVQLADGSTFDIGVDGSNMLTNLDGGKRSPYNTDSTNPLTAQVVGWAMGMTTAITGGNEKLASDFTGYIANAALSNVDTLAAARENILAIFSKTAIPPGQLVQSLTSLHAAEEITTEVYQAQLAGVAALLSGRVQVEGLSLQTRLSELPAAHEVLAEATPALVFQSPD